MSARSPTSSSTQRKTTAPETPTSDHGGGGATDCDFILPPSATYQKSKMGVLCGEEFLSLKFSGIFSPLIHPFKGPNFNLCWNFEPKCFSLRIVILFKLGDGSVAFYTYVWNIFHVYRKK